MEVMQTVMGDNDGVSSDDDGQKCKVERAAVGDYDDDDDAQRWWRC